MWVWNFNKLHQNIYFLICFCGKTIKTRKKKLNLNSSPGARNKYSINLSTKNLFGIFPFIVYFHVYNKFSRHCTHSHHKHFFFPFLFD